MACRVKTSAVHHWSPSSLSLCGSNKEHWPCYNFHQATPGCTTFSTLIMANNDIGASMECSFVYACCQSDCWQEKGSALTFAHHSRPPYILSGMWASSPVGGVWVKDSAGGAVVHSPSLLFPCLTNDKWAGTQVLKCISPWSALIPRLLLLLSCDSAGSFLVRQQALKGHGHVSMQWLAASVYATERDISSCLCWIDEYFRGC